ncbi:methyltransferase type 11 [Cladophialophora carrionii]|uniref:Methyltransferase type 11 n=1 Tax=Cladophialophora carrionii TaxID=86049 RepID=A0A1C1C866_9EURO|nr:methyltransferase type 11 [Cladophialophora carrionii]
MSHFSTTQYDSFSGAYDSVNDLPITRAIVPNVERLVGPHIHGARVLELACGTGFFTRHLLDWGASSIVGVDVSQAMITGAQSELQHQGRHQGKYRFMVADCATPFTVTGEDGTTSLEGQFDLVFAAWLLNYAPDLPTMTEMFKNIARHLAPGGRFVTVLPHPEEDPRVCIDHVNAQYEQGYGYRVELREELPGAYKGYLVELKFDTDPPVEFGNYYLSMRVHEQAARDGGLKGKLTWEEITVPEDQEVLNGYMKEPIPKGYLDEWLKYPDFGILVVEKE